MAGTWPAMTWRGVPDEASWRSGISLSEYSTVVPAPRKRRPESIKADVPNMCNGVRRAGAATVVVMDPRAGMTVRWFRRRVLMTIPDSLAYQHDAG
jgi:hypothetical protein